MPTSIQEASGSLAHSTRQLFWLSIAGSLCLLAIAVGVLWVTSREFDISRNQLAELQMRGATLNELQQLLEALQDAEAGGRGFVVTGQDKFLQPVKLAELSLEERLTQLQHRPLGDSAQAALPELGTQARRELQSLRRIVELRRASGSKAAAELFSEHVGRGRMEHLRGIVESMRASEQQQQAVGLQRYEQRYAATGSAVKVGLSAAIALILIAGLLVSRDIYRRMRAEAAANFAHEVLRETMDNVTQGVAVFNPQHQLVAWNARFAELRALDPEQLQVGMPLAEILSAGRSMTLLHESAAGVTITAPPIGALVPFDLEARQTDGTMLVMRGRPLQSGNYIITYTDVTALKRSESAYRDQAARLSATLDNVVDAIVTINESGSIESWSKGAERLFGYAANEVLRRNVRILMPEPYHSAPGSYIRRYLVTGDSRIVGQRREVEARRKDGSIVPVDLGISEMHIGSRRLFIAVVRDISARLEVDRLKTGFVSTVSHELRTPLTSISGSLGLLAGGAAGALPAKAVRLIDIARANSERLVRLINDILDLEKAAAGQLALHLQVQRLKPVVQQAIEANRAYAEGFGATIELTADSCDAAVLVDRDRLIQVLTNLLSNAAKFSPRGAKVVVAIGTEQDSARIEIRDRGPGLPDEFRARIFQRFAQADSSDSRTKGGTGLGLSIAKTLVEQLGGAIGFDSEPGAGTTFHVTLPIRSDVSHDLSAPPSSDQVPGPVVLVCEDDPDVAQALSDILRSQGMRAQIAATAQAARAALTTGRFDVAIVDLHLPDADGLEFITELRTQEATRALPVIVVTARSRTATDAGYISALELADWLQKPVNPQRLLDTIRTALAARRGGRARILHVEDDVSLTQLVRELLDEDADVTAATSLAEARQAVLREPFDLVILDLTLGDGSGLDLLPLPLDHGRRPPVILYSAAEASREISDKVQAALVKSRNSVEELLANVHALARR